jgi:O-antigen ligase
MKIYINNFINDIFNHQFSLLFISISLIFILFPVTLITGPFLPDLFLSLISLYFLVITFKKKLYSYYRNYFVYIFASFYLLILVSGLLSEDIYASLIDYNGPIFYFRYLFFILGVQYLLDTNPKLISYFTLVLVLTILIAIIDGIIQWQTGYNLLGFAHDPNHGNRITGFFKDEQILGHFLAHVVPLCFGLLLFFLRDSYSKKLLILVLFMFLILSEVFIFITNDRAAFLRIVQFTLLLIFLSNHYKLFRLISFLISLILISLLLNFSSHSSNRYIESTIKDVSSTKIPYMPWTPIHEKHFKVALDFYTEKTLIGNGPQYFRYKCDQIKIKGCTSHPHNYYFQTLAELGIIGISFLFLGFLYLTYILFRQFLNEWFLKNSKYYIPDYLICLYSLAFLFIWPLIPNGSFYNNWLNSMVFLPIAFILYFRNKNC